MKTASSIQLAKNSLIRKITSSTVHPDAKRLSKRKEHLMDSFRKKYWTIEERVSHNGLISSTRLGKHLFTERSVEVVCMPQALKLKNVDSISELIEGDASEERLQQLQESLGKQTYTETAELEFFVKLYARNKQYIDMKIYVIDEEWDIDFISGHNDYTRQIMDNDDQIIFSPTYEHVNEYLRLLIKSYVDEFVIDDEFCSALSQLSLINWYLNDKHSVIKLKNFLA